MANADQVVADLTAVKDQLVKIASEEASLLDKINDLQAQLDAALAAGNAVPQSIVDAVAAVKAQAVVLDDLVPDVAPA